MWLSTQGSHRKALNPPQILLRTVDHSLPLMHSPWPVSQYCWDLTCGKFRSLISDYFGSSHMLYSLTDEIWWSRNSGWDQFRNVQSHWLGFNIWIERNGILRSCRAVWRNHWDSVQDLRGDKLIISNLGSFFSQTNHWFSNLNMHSTPWRLIRPHLMCRHLQSF